MHTFVVESRGSRAVNGYTWSSVEAPPAVPPRERRASARAVRGCPISRFAFMPRMCHILDRLVEGPRHVLGRGMGGRRGVVGGVGFGRHRLGGGRGGGGVILLRSRDGWDGPNGASLNVHTHTTSASRVADPSRPLRPTISEQMGRRWRAKSAGNANLGVFIGGRSRWG